MQIQLRDYSETQQAEVMKILNLDWVSELEQGVKSNPTCCPHCKSEGVRKNGKTNGVQRYKCASCDKTFGATNNTPFFRTQKTFDQWNDFIKLMFDEKPMGVRELGKRIGVDHRTAYFWRHKVLNALNTVKGATLTGVVEADETYMRLSFKGQRKLPRGWKRRKRKRGLSKQQVCVLTAMDRTKNMLLRSTCLASPSAQRITDVLGPYTARDAVLVTDGLLAYQGFARNLGLTHEVLGCATEVRGAYHVQHVNSLHYNFKKRIMVPFNGVATKYLDHYLTYYKWSKLDVVGALVQPTASVSCAELTQRRMTLK